MLRLVGAALLSLAFLGAARTQPPVLTRFAINRGVDAVGVSATVVELTHTAVGERPTQYRVSHRADFSGASWIPYDDVPMLRDWNDASGPSCARSQDSHLVTLFFQVRTVTGADVRVVGGQRALVPTSVESNVMRDSICSLKDRTGESP